MHNTIMEQGENLNFENALYYRGKLKQKDFNIEIKDMMEEIIDKGAKLVNKMMTVSYETTGKDDELFVDVAFILPINKEIDVKEKYKVIKNYSFGRFIRCRYEGTSSEFQQAVIDLNQYVVSRGIKQKTPIHIAYSNEILTAVNKNNMDIEMIIGISD